MEPLTEAQLAELRDVITGEIARIERGLESRKEATRPVQLDQTSVGRLSRIDAMQNQQMSASLYDREMASHAQLIAALHRLDSGTYGRCANCGQPIPYGRLLVFPEARNCAACGGG